MLMSFEESDAATSPGYPTNPESGKIRVNYFSTTYIMVGSTFDFSEDTADSGYTFSECTPGFGVEVGSSDGRNYVRGTVTKEGILEIRTTNDMLYAVFIVLAEPMTTEGQGTESNPYSGAVELLEITSETNVEIWALVGTEVVVTNKEALNMSVSDGFGYGMGYPPGSISFGHEMISGTLDHEGVVDFKSGSGDVLVRVHFLNPTPELEFLSTPSDGLITYVGASP